MTEETILGIDLGGTKLRGGLVSGSAVTAIKTERINPGNSYEEMLSDFFSFTDGLINDQVKMIGIGVPGLVDRGMVYDVMNIPSWKEVPLMKLMEERYRVPVLVNNDANCFALGEFYFGKGKGRDSMVGLTIGTGLGTGIIINRKLYSGSNGGAGEFGMMDYLGKVYEYYASGQFFQNIYAVPGEIVFKHAVEGNMEALKMYEELGHHLGNAIKAILFAVDPGLIILGGSVSDASPYFSATMWQSINSFPYRKTVGSLKIEVSELEYSGILGAAALHINSHT